MPFWPNETFTLFFHNGLIENTFGQAHKKSWFEQSAQTSLDFSLKD